MGRKTDNDHADDEQQTTPNLIKPESQNNPNQDFDEHKFHDSLTHDTILPHRKRIRRDTLLSIQQQYVQPQQQSESTTTTTTVLDVSFSFERNNSKGQQLIVLFSSLSR
jgi:hypothetical protein